MTIYTASGEDTDTGRGFLAGIVAAVPLLLGVLPFGLITGVTAANVGLSLTQMVGMSLLLFSGAAQLAVIDLIGQNAPVAVVIVTAIIINIRHIMYSASIAPYFRRFDTATKWVAAYFLADEIYAVSITEYRDPVTELRSHKLFYFGAATAFFTTWLSSTTLGVVLGANLPSGLSLEFAIPLTYLALLFSVLDDQSTEIAALVGGAVAVLASSVPLNLGLVIAASTGIVAGVVIDIRGGQFPKVDGTDGPDAERSSTTEVGEE
ncbi:AzlC family ABC transporter permease [Halorubrum sp. CSM-61]|jgi:4-azaleucine resistance transporter AzlC|uniref:AzlC family ABC transporter permease n=1 Tax=Halorubrum sp. CSM-61 TaxID=2485838 RepID=UPI000F4BBE70|nr:AzlC family ABC transporter permease [Halorubrum sp. CSM-61]